VAPLVSVVMPVFNSEDFLGKSVMSVKKQSYPEWELLLVDDHSQDSSAKMAQGFSKEDSRIRFLQTERNSGPAVARNLGIKHAKGSLIAFLDSDDMWEPNKLEIQTKFMKDKEIAFSFTWYRIWNEEFTELREVRSPEFLPYRKELLFNHVGTSTVMLDQRKLGKCLFPLFPKCEDYALWLEILRKGEMGRGIQQSLTNYVSRKGSLSSGKLELAKNNWRIYRNVESFGFFPSLFFLYTNFLAHLLKRRKSKTHPSVFSKGEKME